VVCVLRRARDPSVRDLQRAEVGDEFYQVREVSACRFWAPAGRMNPDGRIWIDRLSEGLADTGERLSPADGERIVRLVAHHVGA
jgi:hypothetical protein